jgi:hypothetical protein
MIACSGKDLNKLETREQVYKKFGDPETTTKKDGFVVESYRTRQKIRDNSIRTASLGMGIVMTYGFGEFYLFPRELFILTRRTVLGQTISFAYDDDGDVKYATLDGEKVGWWGSADDRKKYRETHPLPPPEPQAAP